MGLIDELADPGRWREFQAHKLAKGQLSAKVAADLADYLEQAGWRPVLERLQTGQGFGIPARRAVNKLGSAKQRIVYSFPRGETWVLKHLAYRLYRYDDRQPAGCYSFRPGYGAHRGIRELVRRVEGNDWWCYRGDVRDYFNSIPIPRLLPELQRVIDDDLALYDCLAQLLTADLAYSSPHSSTGRRAAAGDAGVTSSQGELALGAGELVAGPRGVMAGLPVAPFLANLYLREVDNHFTAAGYPYARYSDDIIFFTPDEDEVRRQAAWLGIALAELGLEINPAKAGFFAPGQPWDYLGISYHRGRIDLSGATKAKLKAKIRRKARALHRWWQRKPATPEQGVKAMLRSFNRKFFESQGGPELTWSRWFFPLLTTTDGLHQIDAYLLQEARSIPTGRHGKANYRLRYQQLKALGYRSLVHEYFAYQAAKSQG